jgi:Protein of unknown function (DUF3822)
LTPSISARNNIYLLEEAQNTRCVMLIGKGYLTYTITNEEYNTVYLINHYQSGTKAFTKNDLQSILELDEVNKAEQVTVALDSYKNTLVPFALYNAENKNEYLQLVEELYPDEEIFVHNITDSLIDLFTVKSGTQVLLLGMLNHPSIQSASAVLLRNYPNQLKSQLANNLFISVKEDMVFITHYQNQALQLHQQYAYAQELDVLYFVCNLIQVKNIDANSCHFQLHGEHMAVAKIHDILAKHFTHVKYCTRISGIQYPDSLYSQPAHYFYNLFSVFACAL